MDIWTYDPETRRMLDANGLKVAADVVPEDALIILSMQAALIDFVKCGEIDATLREENQEDGVQQIGRDAAAALAGSYQSKLIDSALPDTHWEAHTGEDYSVVMAIDEATDNASIHVYGEDPAGLAQRIASALNRSHRAEAMVEPAAPPAPLAIPRDSLSNPTWAVISHYKITDGPSREALLHLSHALRLQIGPGDILAGLRHWQFTDGPVWFWSEECARRMRAAGHAEWQSAEAMSDLEAAHRRIAALNA